MPNILIDIDCTKITKARLNKGKYLKAVLIETPNSKYGNDFMIVENVTKEERDQGIKGGIIGNARHMAFKPVAPPVKQSTPSATDQDEDIPF